MQHWTDKLVELEACSEAIEWAENYDSLADAWAVCSRGDWLLWYINIIISPLGADERKNLVIIACSCARTALEYVRAGENRPRLAIEAAEQWAWGVLGTTLSDVRIASAAAYAAGAASAASAASDAAYAAASAAYAASDAAVSKSSARCADIVRKVYPTPPEGVLSNG
jgi:hypothetical protein